MLICSVTQSCLTLCDSMDHSPLGFSIHGISQARILERVAISSFRRSFQPRDRTHISCIGRQIFFFFLTTEPPGKPKVKGLVAQSCPHGHELYSLMDYSLSNSSVHGILQARILEYIAIPFSRESSWPRIRTWVSCFAGRFFTIWNTLSLFAVTLFKYSKMIKKIVSSICCFLISLALHYKAHQLDRGKILHPNSDTPL